MDIEPNSLESVIFFTAYICGQDNRIGKEELSKILSNSQVIKNLKDSSFLNNSINSLEEVVSSISSHVLQNKNFLKKAVSPLENQLISSLLTVPELIDMSIRSARIAASEDGFHETTCRKSLKLEAMTLTIILLLNSTLVCNLLYVLKRRKPAG